LFYQRNGIKFSANNTFGPFEGGGIQQTIWVSDSKGCTINATVTLPPTGKFTK
jgi:hypothetical protein